MPASEKNEAQVERVTRNAALRLIRNRERSQEPAAARTEDTTATVGRLRVLAEGRTPQTSCPVCEDTGWARSETTPTRVTRCRCQSAVGVIPQARPPITAPPPLPSPRSKKPQYQNERFVVWSWQVDELRSMLGRYADTFNLEEWLIAGAYARARDIQDVTPDWWKWLKKETLDEAARRGLLGRRPT